jgi:hypothetical protein
MISPSERPLELFSSLPSSRRVPDPTIERQGKTFDAEMDGQRLAKQHKRVKEFMADGQWRTLEEIHQATGDPESSVSARLRDLRKPQHGGHIVERRRRGEGHRGLFEYRLVA